MKTPEHKYEIVKYFQDGRDPELVRAGLTLEQAQGHCSSETTHGPGWFHGYRETVRPSRGPFHVSATRALSSIYHKP